jgi:hypothetical protein
VFAGGVLSCGRFYFNSADQSGAGLRASSGAVYFEPYAGTAVSIFGIIVIRVSASYIFPIAGFTDHWMGPGTPVPVNPSGMILTFTFGYPLISTP